jgi:hypothetical protein
MTHMVAQSILVIGFQQIQSLDRVVSHFQVQVRTACMHATGHLSDRRFIGPNRILLLIATGMTLVV